MAGFPGGFTQLGGFMATHTDQSPVEEKRNDVASDTLRSFTIAQLAKAQREFQSDRDLSIDGRPIKNVTIVGVLHSKQGVEANLLTQIDDGTGKISARKWLDDASEDMSLLQEGRYVRVYGAFSGNSSNPHELGEITAYSIRPVIDHNEVVYHNLEVIFQHMYLTKGMVKSQGMGLGLHQHQFGMTAQLHSGAMPIGDCGAARIGMSAPPSAMDPTQQCKQAIEETLAALPTKSCDPNTLSQRLAVNFPGNVVTQALGDLEREGLIMRNVMSNAVQLL